MRGKFALPCLNMELTSLLEGKAKSAFESNRLNALLFFIAQDLFHNELTEAAAQEFESAAKGEQT